MTIGAASGQAAQLGIEAFLRFMAFFSVNLAVLSLLPIPVLDGGHLAFLGIEAVRGKALSVKQRLRWSQLGVVVVLGIMLLALSNDILRLFGLCMLSRLGIAVECLELLLDLCKSLLGGFVILRGTFQFVLGLLSTRCGILCLRLGLLHLLGQTLAGDHWVVVAQVDL